MYHDTLDAVKVYSGSSIRVEAFRAALADAGIESHVGGGDLLVHMADLPAAVAVITHEATLLDAEVAGCAPDWPATPVSRDHCGAR